MFATKNKTTVLLLTSQGLYGYCWQQDTLSPFGKFSADGLADFDRHLEAALASPVYLVADLIEEDFRVEPVAHVLGRDRKVVLERKLLQFFRTAEYRAARIQDREGEGRRDDKVLFSALTNTDQLNLWVDRLLEKKIQIRGILSAALLMELFTGFRHLEQIPHLLLVNLDPQSGLRQTFLQSGYLKFSRLLSLTAIRAGSLTEILRAECGHTRQYLERLKLLSRDQPLEIHIHVQDGYGEGLRANLQDSPLLHFHLHETGMVAAELGIDPAAAGDRGTVFLALVQALRAKGLSNVYAPAAVTRYHRLHRMRRGIIGGTSLMVAVALLAGGGLLFDGFNARTLQQQQHQEALTLDGRYRQLRRDFPETPLPAAVLQNVVEAMEVTRHQAVSPLRMLTGISRAVTLCPEIRLQRIDWQLSAGTPAIDNSSIEESSEGTGGPNGQITVSPLLPELLAGKTSVVTTLNGMVSPNTGYGDAQNSVFGFITALEQIPGLKVTPITMPTETKPEATVKATLDGNTLLAEFALQLDYTPQP